MVCGHTPQPGAVAGCVSGLMHEQGTYYNITHIPVQYHLHCMAVGGGKGSGPKSHIFDFPNGTAIWRKFAKLHMQLFPYIYTQAHIAHKVPWLLYMQLACAI